MPVFGLRVQWIRVAEQSTPGNGKADGAHSLHLRLGSLLRLGERSLEPAPDQHRDPGHHRVVRELRPATTDRSTSTSRCPGELELAVERLTSGNQLYDRELRRRMDARRYPTIAGRVTGIVRQRTASRVLGHRRDLVPRQDQDVRTRDADRAYEEAASSLTGEYVFDIREFGMKPPSMLMVRVYPEISVRVELHGNRDS